MRESTSASQASGSTSLSFAVMISVAMTAARSAPRSEPGKEPRFASQCKSAQGALSRVVREADAAVFDEPREPIPALEHVVDWLGDRGRTRHTGTLLM